MGVGRQAARSSQGRSPLLLGVLALGACGGVTAAPLVQGAAPPPASSTFRTAVRKALPALVFVQVKGPREVSPTDVGSGSGFVLSAEGHILTNTHVVQEAASVTVVLSDNREFEAVVVGRDPDTDIAVLKIAAQGLTAAPLDRSDSLQVGDWVLALGYPLGLSATVTAGIVSATGRSLGILQHQAEVTAPLEHYIQTDAAINRGNSGGPLVNLEGQVVGVNSAIASPTGYFTGYGFAVPIHIARRVASDLIRFGEVRRPQFGGRIGDVTPADAEVYRLASVAGAKVVAVSPGGPAAQAGLEPGDVVRAVGSAPVRSAADLQAAIADHSPGDRVQLTVVRYGRPLAPTILLGRLHTGVAPTIAPTHHPGRVALGFTVTLVEEEVHVVEVEPYSTAARAGLRPGQVILAVNRQPVRSRDEFDAALREFRPSTAISLRVRDPDLGETVVNYRPETVHAVP
ncbi:MAG TPA: trypsin-like peptidase domain-containing protein [Gemmatimonadales bacterium]|nr:trypsin-like peptidase domain-containing protein [Gemmatimonadales bacterium]